SSPGVASACFWGCSWGAASSAARWLRVTVGWGFPDFLAAIVDRLLFERLAKRCERLASDAADRGQDPYEIRARHANVIHGHCRPNDQMRPGSIRKRGGAGPARPA